MPTIIRLETVNDSRVSDYRNLRDPELVRRRGLFVTEGRLVVERLIASGRYAIRSLLLSEAAHAAMRSSVEGLPASVPVYVCAASEVLQVTGVDIHRGCLALVERPAAVPVEVVVDTARTLVVLEGIADPDNVGGIFRNAAAFNADAVLLSPSCCDPLYRKAIRTSMAATLHVPFARLGDWPAGLEMLRSRGFVIAAFTTGFPSQTVDDVAGAPRPTRMAMLFGGEGAGLTAAACDRADIRVRIPICDDVDSLNVAVAAGIALSRFTVTSR